MNYTHQPETTLVTQRFRKDFSKFRIRTAFLSLISLFCFLAIPQNAWSGDINGTVVDANTGSYVPGASIRIVDLGRITTTDRSGEFRIPNVPAGTHTVTVRFIGYEAVTESVQVPESGSVNPSISIGGEALELEGFTVEGYREGKALALQQKKTAPSIRDILSADSVGQIPDRNVADALVRLPGVALDMSNGEGRFVSIRGIAPDLNNVTVNGATVANPGVDGRSGRAMPLDVIGSSQISQLEVIKAITPDMDAQGLGGTIEIKTASAFDKEEGYFNGSIEGGYADQPEDYAYRGEVTWATRLGAEKKLGIALSGTYEWRPYENEAVDLRWDQDDFLTDFDNDGVFEGEFEDYAYVKDLELIPEFGNRQRIGVNTKIEWKPNEDTEFYLNGIWNQFTEWETGIEITLEGDRLDYDEDQAYLTEGGSRDKRLSPFLTSPTTLWFPSVDALQQRIGVEKREQSLINVTVGGKKRWGNFTVTPEFTYSNAKEKVIYEGQIQFRGRLAEGEMVMRAGDAPISSFNGTPFPFFIDPEGDGLVYDETNQRLSEIDGPTGGDAIPVLFDFSGSLPNVSIPREAATDGSRLAHRRNRIDTSLVEENTYIPKIDLQWDFDNFLGGNSGFIKTGVKYFNRNRLIDDNSLRPIFCTESVDPQTCLDRENVFRNGDAIRPSAADFPNSTVPAEKILGLYDPGVKLQFQTPWQDSMGGTNPTAGNTLFPFVINDVESSENNIEDDYDLDEKILSYYGMISLDIGERLNLITGVRIETTDVDITANQWTRFDDFGGDISPCSTFDADAESSFCLETTNSSFNYDDVFPSVQATFRITDNLQLRAAFTTATGRPNFEDAAPITRMETTLDSPADPANGELGVIDELRARIRNPQLQPYYAYNYDVSLEYYTDWGAAFSFAAFHKEIKDPIFSFETDDRFRDLDPREAPDFVGVNADGDDVFNFSVAAATAVVQERCACDVNTTFLDPDDLVARLRMEGWDNAEHGRVTGIELSASMPFTFLPQPLDGFGFDANISFIDSEFDIFERRDLDNETPFFQQPSKIANAAIYYQKGRFQGRVAFRYQDESFDEVDDPSNDFGDRYDAPREQWDAQASYRVTDHWTAYFNVTNFTDQQDIRWFGNTPRRVNTIEQFGSVWRFGLRWNY